MIRFIKEEELASPDKPGDGWYMIEAQGEHGTVLDDGRRIIQELDNEAMKDLCRNWEKNKQNTPLVAPEGSNEKTQVKALKKALDRVAKKGGCVTGVIHKERVGALTVKGGTVGKKGDDFKGGSGVAHVLRKHGNQGMSTRKMAVTAVKGKVMPDPKVSRSRIVHKDNLVVIEHEMKKGSGRKSTKGGKLLTAHKRRNL